MAEADSARFSKSSRPLLFRCPSSSVLLTRPSILAAQPRTTWKVPNAYSNSSQQCYPFVQPNQSGAGTWSSPGTASTTDGVYTNSATITPTKTGSYDYAVSCGGVVSGYISLTVNSAPLSISPTSLAAITAETPYSETLTPSGGSGTGYQFSITEGSASLTALGLSLSSGRRNLRHTYCWRGDLHGAAFRFIGRQFSAVLRANGQQSVANGFGVADARRYRVRPDTCQLDSDRRHCLGSRHFCLDYTHNCAYSGYLFRECDFYAYGYDGLQHGNRLSYSDSERGAGLYAITIAHVRFGSAGR